MPLPRKAIKIAGGCKCSAIRYRVSIPPILERQIHPTFDTSTGKEPVRLPFICVDHCNDCRKATAALLGVVLCSPMPYIEMSLLPGPRDYTEKDPTDVERAWFPADDIIPPGTKSRDGTTLWYYTSSEGRTRFLFKLRNAVRILGVSLPRRLPADVGYMNRKCGSGRFREGLACSWEASMVRYWNRLGQEVWDDREWWDTEASNIYGQRRG